MKVKVTQLCPTVCDPMDYTVHGILQKPFPSPGDLPNPGIEPWPPALQADSLPADTHNERCLVNKWGRVCPLQGNSGSIRSPDCKGWRLPCWIPALCETWHAHRQFHTLLLGLWVPRTPCKTFKMTCYWMTFLSMLIPVFKFFCCVLKNDRDVIANECWQITNWQA